MDQDYSSPAARYFQDEAYDITKDGDILYISYNFLMRRAIVSIDNMRLTDMTPTGVDIFFKKVADEYEVKVPKKMIQKVKEFVTLSRNAFSLDVRLAERTYCDSCYDTNGPSIQAFYFPAINDTLSASVGVFYDFGGCFGDGDRVFGSVEDSLSGALSSLNRAKADADDSDAAREVKNFINTLTKTTN